MFTPPANANNLTAPVQIRMTTDDQANGGPGALTDTDTFAVSVTPVNDAPVAVENSYEGLEDAALSSNVLGNDSDVEGEALTAVLVNGPSHGALTLNPDGSFTYTPASNYSGTDTFTYRASDGTGLSNVATVTITITPVEDPIQVIVPGTQSTVEDTPLTFSTANGNAITIIDPDSPRVLVNMSAFGTLSLATTEGLEFPYPDAAANNSSWIMFYADSPAIANAALDGLRLHSVAGRHARSGLHHVGHRHDLRRPAGRGVGRVRDSDYAGQRRTGRGR